MNRATGLAAGIATLFAFAAPSGGSLVPISQEGTVFAASTVFGETDLEDEDSAAAADFSPFSETAEVNLVDGFSAARATASQASSISPTLVVAEGSARASGSEDFGAIAFSDASSEFELVFEIAETTLWQVDASAAALEQLSSPFAEITFDGPGFENDFVVSWDASDSFSGLLELAPGTYTVTALAVAGARPTELDSDSTQASFAFSMVLVPEPGAAILLGAGLLGLAAGRGRRER